MAARKKVQKPAPVIVQTICSICGEDWAQHREADGEVSTLECVRLLKAKIAFTPTVVIQRPYVTPIYYPPTPWWQTTPQWTITCGSNAQGNMASSSQYVQNTNDCTPTVALASAAS